MTLDEAGEILSRMRNNAPRGEVSIQAILFGIKYHSEIEGLTSTDIALQATGVPPSAEVELDYGRKLAKYVTLREEVI